MKERIKNILIALDDSLFRFVVKLAYPAYERPRRGYQYNFKILSSYFIAQKILRINAAVPWPVHFTSKVLGVEHIEKGICCDPGDNIGVYINAYGGLKLGNNVNIGQNSVITTTNHYKYDHRKLSTTKGVVIGSNVWIGANCSIVAGSKIGDNVTIGAGCVIRGEIPSNCTVINSNTSLSFIPKSKDYEWDCTKDELI
ncbi:MAG: acyltransferase [Chitinophagales bacterium]|nr:acyltransferase [Chitinophagales bacterium]